MPRFSANLSMLFPDTPFLDRFALAAKAGFKAVEYLVPTAFKSRDLGERIREHNLKQALFNMPAGDWAAGERGVSALLGREDEFVQSLDVTLEYAKATGTPCVHLMAGKIPQGADLAEMERLYTKHLAQAADFFAPHGITVCIEPLSTHNTPGYFLRTQAQGAKYIEELGRPNLKLQFDFFHVQLEEGNVAVRFRQFFPLIGHCQMAGVPERHEPDTGELRYEYIFDVVDGMGYQGYIGCEYAPARGTMEGLGWFEPYREHQ